MTNKTITTMPSTVIPYLEMSIDNYEWNIIRSRRPRRLDHVLPKNINIIKEYNTDDLH